MAFWKELLKCMYGMDYKRSRADPCLYYKHVEGRLNMWVSWIDDCLNIGAKEDVDQAIQDMKDRFDCDEVDDLSEYIGCKLEHNKEERSIKFTQPVLLQSFEDEFELPERGDFKTPAPAGQVLMRGDEQGKLNEAHQRQFRKGVGKLLYLTRWSRPDIRNAVRELTRCVGVAKEAHFKAMLHVMKYCVNTPERGWTIKPQRKWDGKSPIEVVIRGKSDSNMASCAETRKSISGTTVYLEGVPVIVRSGSQEKVSLSICQSEFHSGVSCVQDMLFTRHIVESVGIKVKLPMVLFMDNQAAVDLANGWSIAGRTRHMDTPTWFIRELKEQGILRIEWIAGETKEADMYTKNLPGKLFEKHMRKFCTG
jgi:Reverse transcriptase (RNA-dependent DNA polymerase).